MRKQLDSVIYDYNIRGLIAAVLINALSEARAGNREAEGWLFEDGKLWMDAIDFEIRERDLRQWLRQRKSTKLLLHAGRETSKAHRQVRHE